MAARAADGTRRLAALEAARGGGLGKFPDPQKLVGVRGFTWSARRCCSRGGGRRCADASLEANCGRMRVRRSSPRVGFCSRMSGEHTRALGLQMRSLDCKCRGVKGGCWQWFYSEEKEKRRGRRGRSWQGRGCERAGRPRKLVRRSGEDGRSRRWQVVAGGNDGVAVRSWVYEKHAGE